MTIACGAICCISSAKSPNFQANKLKTQVNKEFLTTPARSAIVLDKLRVNHYWTRDEAYFWNIKIPRQIQLYGGSDLALQQYQIMKQSNDFAIQRFVPKLGKRMGLK